MSKFPPQSTAPPRRYIITHESEGVIREYLCLPDTMKSWPWRRKINPHRDAAAAESAAWLEGLKLLSDLMAVIVAECIVNAYVWLTLSRTKPVV